jgi:predicted DNA-binding transcriptional regulator AlpA
MLPKLYNANELAAEIRLVTSTLRQMLMAGSGPRYIKLGDRVVYAEKDVLAWLEAQPRPKSTSDSAA